MGFKPGDRVVVNDNGFPQCKERNDYIGQTGVITGAAHAFEWSVQMDDESLPCAGDWLLNSNEIDLAVDE